MLSNSLAAVLTPSPITLRRSKLSSAESDMTRSAVHGDVIWTEWEMTGNRRDGSAHCVRGVIIFGVRGSVAQWARFYLEPLDLSGGTVDDPVREHAARR